MNPYTMQLIADSGSTSTVWYLENKKKRSLFKTEGYNPYYFSTDEVALSIASTLKGAFDFAAVCSISFYGAGCSNAQSSAVISGALSTVFPQAEIVLGDDLIAAARATAAYSSGVCCILGTGSNSCVYDGQKILRKIPSLGYILGDEGAGSQIGKALISSYFYQEMPPDLATTLSQFYPMDKHQIISKLFNHKTPNRYLASFVQFGVDHQQHPYIRQLIQGCFDTFLRRHVLKYPESKHLPIHFVGSVAFGFKELLEQALKQHKLKIGRVLKSPFPALLDY